MPKGENLVNNNLGNRFGEGQVTNNGGRKKKIFTILKERGYGADDIKTAILEMAFSNLAELKAIHADESKPVILRIIANQFEAAFKNSDYKKINDLMQHVLGLPKQAISMSSEGHDKPVTIFYLPDNGRG